jgi:hypothetical protein
MYSGMQIKILLNSNQVLKPTDSLVVNLSSDIFIKLLASLFVRLFKD